MCHILALVSKNNLVMSDSVVFSFFFLAVCRHEIREAEGAQKFYTFIPETLSWAVIGRSIKALQTTHWPNSVEVARLVIQKRTLNSGFVSRLTDDRSCESDFAAVAAGEASSFSIAW